MQQQKTIRDFRIFLQDELTNRCARNPNYSLRAFAKFLEISPSALSALINGKRPISQKTKQRLGIKLGLQLRELEKFKVTPHGNRKNLDAVDRKEFQQVTIDTFSIISEPHHYALLELIKTENFKWDTKWIARRLKLTVSEVNIAINRLERVGLLSRNENGELYDTTDGFSTDIRDGLTTEGQRKFQQRSLERAIATITQVPLSMRDNTSVIMAINSVDIPQAKQMLKEFRRKFCRQLENNKQLNEVYQLTLSFIPITSGGEK